MASGQLELPFDALFAAGDNPAVWTPRDIWVRLTQSVMAHFGEDRRIEYKGGEKVDFDDFATYLSTFSNSPDGGTLVFGADSFGAAKGCSGFSANIVNRLETCHIKSCPQAKPEFKRIPVIVNNKPDFCIAIYIPYVGKLVETNKQEAWIRYGESRHRMSEEEKRDFRATRQELSFEMEVAPYKFPEDFNLRIIQDFCDAFRQREGRSGWSNQEVLLDRFLLKIDGGLPVPLNALVLLAARDPRRTIPGCRVRVQRFAAESEGSGEGYNPIKDKFIEGNIVET